jgi:hypothetical protein
MHWRTRRESSSKPLIVAALACTWFVDETDRPQDSDCWGEVLDAGHKVVFSSYWFLPGGSHYLKRIAHELCHVFFLAVGEPSHIEAAATIRTDLGPTDDPIYMKCEKLANELCSNWGFS